MRRSQTLPSILYVHGICGCPAHGYKIQLRRAPEQESDSAVLVLDLVVNTPANPVSEARELLEVEYWETPSQRYREVHIRPCNVVVPISEAP